MGSSLAFFPQQIHLPELFDDLLCILNTLVLETDHSSEQEFHQAVPLTFCKDLTERLLMEPLTGRMTPPDNM